MNTLGRDIVPGDEVIWTTHAGTSVFVVLGTGIVGGAPTALIAPVFNAITEQHASVSNQLAPIAELTHVVLRRQHSPNGVTDAVLIDVMCALRDFPECRARETSIARAAIKAIAGASPMNLDEKVAELRDVARFWHKWAYVQSECDAKLCSVLRLIDRQATAILNSLVRDAE